MKAGKNMEKGGGPASPRPLSIMIVHDPPRGIMMVMALVIIAIVSIITMAVMPFFGTIKERAVQEEGRSIVEQARRAIVLDTMNLNGSISEDDQFLMDNTLVQQLGTEAGEKLLRQKAAEIIMQRVRSGHFRSAGLLRNQGDFATLLDNMKLTVTRNLIRDSSFEYEAGQAAEDIGIEWHTGAAENAEHVDGTTFEIDEAQAFVKSMTDETPNSFKTGGVRIYRRMQQMTRDTANNDVKTSKTSGGAYGSSSLSIWNPSQTEVTK